MHDLISYFRDNDAESIEMMLCEDEEVVINQEGDDPVDIVANFAELIPSLTGGRTADDVFEIRYQNRTLKVSLEQRPTDEDATRRAIRDILQPDYAIRVLRSCLGTDTLAFTIDTPEVWQTIDTQFSDVAAQLFTPFTDDIGFDATS